MPIVNSDNTLEQENKMSDLVIGLGILVLVSGLFLTISWKNHLKIKKYEEEHPHKPE